MLINAMLGTEVVGRIAGLLFKKRRKKMNNEQFILLCQQSTLRRTEVLKKKEKEYSTGKDRLEQFHRAAAAQNILPTEALIGMMTKHFTSVTDMAKDPSNFTFRQWHEKLDDLRNYCDLLDALITDVKE